MAAAQREFLKTSLSVRRPLCTALLRTRPIEDFLELVSKANVPLLPFGVRDLARRRSKSPCDPSAIARTTRLIISAFMVWPLLSSSFSSASCFRKIRPRFHANAWSSRLQHVAPATPLPLCADMMASVSQRTNCPGDRGHRNTKFHGHPRRRVTSLADQREHVLETPLNLSRPFVQHGSHNLSPSAQTLSDADRLPSSKSILRESGRQLGTFARNASSPHTG